MYNLYFKYKCVERKREKIGFSVSTVEKEDLLDSFNTVEEAKHHKKYDIENQYKDGFYVIKKVS